MKFKILLLTIFCTIFTYKAYCQEDTVIVGTSNSSVSPWGGGCQFSFQQSLYTVSQIGRSGEISSISFKKSSGGIARNLTIYIGHSKKNCFQSLGDIIHTDSLTLVYHGYINTGATPLWDQINFTTPFQYNGLDNLIISIIDSSGTLTSQTHYVTHNYYKSMIVIASSIQPINPNNPVFQHSAVTDILLNTRFIFTHDTISCSIPNLTFNNITYSSCSPGWSNSNCCHHWNLGFKESDKTSWTILDIQNSQTLMLDSLNMFTKYDVVFRNINDLSDTTNWVYKSFRTKCGPCTQYPLKENFDNYIYQNATYPPSCWSSLYQTTNIHIANYFPYSLPFSFRFNNNDIITIPKIDEPLNQFAVRLRAGVYGSNNNSVLQIGCMSDTNNVNSFIILDTIQLYTPNVWREIYSTMQNAPSSHKYLAFRGIGSQLYIDDVEVDFESTCDRVMYPTIDSISAHTARFSWNSLNQESLWEIAYGIGAFNPDTCSSIAIASSNPFVLSGLVRDTLYNAYIRSVCSTDSKSEWTSVLSFHTLFSDCENPIQLSVVPNTITAHTAQLQWVSNGNETEWEICYKNTYFTNPDTTGTHVIANTSLFTLTNLPNNSSIRVYLRAVCDSLEKSHWIGPLLFNTLLTDCPIPTQISIPDSTKTGSTAKIHWKQSFNSVSYQVVCQPGSYHPDYSTGYTTINVNDTTVNLVGLLNNTYYTVFIRSTCGTYGTSIWVSKTFTTQFSDCPKPSNLVFESINDSITIHWNSGGSICQSYNLKVNSIDHNNNTLINVNLTDTFYSFQKLLNTSYYNFEIRSVCDTMVSDWYRDTVNICESFRIGLPFIENFINTNGTMNLHCWENQFINNTYPVEIYYYAAGTIPFNDYGMLYFNSRNNPSGSMTRFVSSPISTLDFYDLKYSFAWYVTTLNPDSIDGVTIQYSFDKINWIDASNRIDRRASSYGLVSNQWIIIQDSLPNCISNIDTVYIGLLFYSAKGNTCLLDSLVFSGTHLICSPPSNISIENITTTTAIANWENESTDFSAWIFKYKKTSDSIFVTQLIFDPFIELFNLSPNTSYDIQIKKMCSFNLESNDSEIISFTTLDDSSINSTSQSNHIVQVTPNPFYDFIDVKCDLYPIKEIYLFDLAGRLLNKIEVNNHFKTMLFSNYKSGSYILKITFYDQTQISKQIIKIQ